MRMKAVCEATGLTDRTVRYYIEEGLISPDYTESYTGRKTFDFCEADIRQLNDIAVLRKFGFTVAEIRDMLRDPAQIEPTVHALRERKRLQIEEEQALLLALERLTTPCENVAELALVLSTPVQTALVPLEDSSVDHVALLLNFTLSIIKAMLTWAPIVVALVALLEAKADYEYPIFSPKMLRTGILFLIPSVIILNWTWLQERLGWKKHISGRMWFLCLLCIPLSALFFGGAYGHSETTDMLHYRRFDGRCIINRDSFFADFFPTWPHYFENVENEEGHFETVYLDAKYYYRFLEFMDYTYDVYAEWPLDQKEFDKEVARVRELFESTESAKQNDGYVELQTGPWTCLILYGWGQEPFEEPTNNYSFYIFAYDPEALRVRYICCDSLENGMDQPYYLELDWE